MQLKEYPAIHSGRRTIYFGFDADNRTPTLAHWPSMTAASRSPRAHALQRMFLGLRSAWCGLKHVIEIELDGGETRDRNSVTWARCIGWRQLARLRHHRTGASGVGEDCFSPKPQKTWSRRPTGAASAQHACSRSWTGGFTAIPPTSRRCLPSTVWPRADGGRGENAAVWQSVQREVRGSALPHSFSQWIRGRGD